MSEMAKASEVSPESLRELCARLGLSPSEDELAAMALGVQRLYENDRLVQGLVELVDEPATAPRPRTV